jgi:hypothetical protein
MKESPVPDFAISPDYNQNPQQMPRPYVRFEMRPVERRDAKGVPVWVDVVWARVVPPGGKDVLEKLADDWINGLQQMADDGRVPPQWPQEYRQALEAWKRGEELPVTGTPIKLWPGVSPAQRAAVLAAGILTVEDLAQANDEAKTRIGMGAQALVESAKAWVKDATGPGALAKQLQDALVKNEALEKQLAELLADVKELKAAKASA